MQPLTTRSKRSLGAVLLLVLVVALGGFAAEALGVLHGPSSGTTDREPTISFESVAAERGLTYTADSNDDGTVAMISDVGVYVADYDKDGWSDVLLTGGGHPALFTNHRGEFRRSGVLAKLNGSVRSALFVDVNSDGWEDLLLFSSGRPPLLLENHEGSFERADAGFERPLAVPIGATAADFNHDGCPDLFVIQNGKWDDEPPLGLNRGSVPFGDDNGEPNVLYEGTCGEFDRRTDAGIEGTRWSLATSFVDLTNDGWADIHVANDFNRDVVYVNQRDGTFDQVVLSNRTNRNGMASEVADVTGDGRPDVFTTNIYHPTLVRETVPVGQQVRAKGNTLLVNRGNGTFVDRADALNVRVGGWGWAAVLDDFDNDRDMDLFHSTQLIEFTSDNVLLNFDETDIRYLERNAPYYRYPVVAERNESGFTRLNAVGVGFVATDGRGAAELDFDRDGNLDLIVANADGAYRLYRNVGETESSLQITLDGRGKTSPLGATVSVITDEKTERRQYTSNADFLSQGSRTFHFGTGTHDAVTVRVVWPDGTEQTFVDVRTGQRIVVTPDRGLSADGR